MIHRFKNALEYSSKYGIPLIGDFIAFTSKKIKIQERWEVFLPRTIRLGTTSIHMFHIKYDSIAPFALTITDEEDSVGIIPDGKLTEEWQSAIQLLLSCNQIYFGNVRSQFPKSPESLSNRYRSTYNTHSEIEYLFRDYKGMRIFAEKENQL